MPSPETKMNNDVPLTIVTLPIWWYTAGFSIVWKWFNKHYHRAVSAHKQSIAHDGQIGLIVIKPPTLLSTTAGKMHYFYELYLTALRIALLCTVLVFYILVLPAVLTAIFYQLLGLYAS